MQKALDAKYYLGPAGATPTEEFHLMEAKLNDTRTEQERSWRATQYKLTWATTRGVSVSGVYPWDETDAQFATLRDAYNDNTPVAMKVVSKESADGLNNGSGIDADWIITQFDRDDTDDQISLVSVTFKPTYETRFPQEIQNTLT